MKNEISVQELKQLDPSTYQLIDIRSAIEISHGAIPGAKGIPMEELLEDPLENPKLSRDKTIIICCNRGKFSKEAAEELREAGLDAVSLAGGYNGWLMAQFEDPEDASGEKKTSAEDPAGQTGACVLEAAPVLLNPEDAGQTASSACETEQCAGKKKKKPLDFCEEVEQSLRKKFKKTIWSKFTKAINQYELVKEGDRIAVCISGGKDSMLMAKLFQELKRHNKFDFEVKFLVMDPGYNELNRRIIEKNAKKLRVPITVFESDIFESVFQVEKSPCYLCARMRRGYLYRFAKELGCNKIALGHHYDDVIETILMGMLYGAQVQTMMPKLHSTNFEGMELIRPLYLVREEQIKAWRDYNGLHFIQCACKFTDTCTSCNNENRSKRVEIKELIQTLKQTNPFVEGNIFKSVENVNLDTVVAYKSHGQKHHFLDTYDEKGNASEI